MSSAELGLNMEEYSLSKLQEKLQLYDGCGNKLGVVPLTLSGYASGKDWRKDRELRTFLTGWGVNDIYSDSVMVLTGDPRKSEEQGYDFFMDVFEPMGTDATGGDLPGGVSTMCGNGVRAVAAYICNELKPGATVAKIMTRSGLREIIREGNNYIVQMGELTTKSHDLRHYVNSEIALPNSEGNYLNAEIPEEIARQLGFAKTWSIGFNGDRNNGSMDGEPHAIIEVPYLMCPGIDQLKALAVKLGNAVTKKFEIFPAEMNANFMVVEPSHNGNVPEILVCTHERNLGGDSEHSVTAACGTGSTVAGGVFFERTGASRVKVHCLGGDLEIAKVDGGRLTMKGPANKVPYSYKE